MSLWIYSHNSFDGWAKIMTNWLPTSYAVPWPHHGQAGRVSASRHAQPVNGPQWPVPYNQALRYWSGGSHALTLGFPSLCLLSVSPIFSDWQNVLSESWRKFNFCEWMMERTVFLCQPVVINDHGKYGRHNGESKNLIPAETGNPIHEKIDAIKSSPHEAPQAA